MLRAIHTAATGMEAMQTNLENVSNNLANVQTNSYKENTAQFEDLMYQTLREPGTSTGSATQTPTGVQVGSGVKVSSVHKVFRQGPDKPTNVPTDLLINGEGFFAVQKETGAVEYTRDGAFKVDAQGRMQTTNGHILVPNITIPPNSVSIIIAPTGAVSTRDAEGKLNQIGQI